MTTFWNLSTLAMAVLPFARVRFQHRTADQSNRDFLCLSARPLFVALYCQAGFGPFEYVCLENLLVFLLSPVLSLIGGGIQILSSTTPALMLPIEHMAPGAVVLIPLVRCLLSATRYIQAPYCIDRRVAQFQHAPAHLSDFPIPTALPPCRW
jgi:hypothetical protein